MTVTPTVVVLNESPIRIVHEPAACDVTASVPLETAPYVATPEHPETEYVPLKRGSVTVTFCVCPVPLNERLDGDAAIGPGVGVGLGVGVGVGVGDGVGVGVGDGVGDAVGLAVGDAVGLEVGDAVGDAVAVGLAVGLAVGEAVGDAVAIGVGVSWPPAGT